AALFDASADPSVYDDAEASVRSIMRGIEGLARDPADIEAANEALYGAHLAGKVLSTAKLSLHHKLAHVLGGSFGTAHAATHSVLLPFTLAYNAPASEPAMRRLRRALDHRDPAACLFDRAAALDMSTLLSVIGFQRQHIERAVVLATSQPYANPRPVTPEGMRVLLSDAVHGRRPSLTTRRQVLADVRGVHDGLDATGWGAELHKARAVVIAVHGRGSSADAFVQRLSPHLGSDVAVLGAQADSNTWYPKGFRDVQANEEHVRSALSALDAVYELAAAAVPPERIVVVGFSQGACLALTWLASRRDRVRPQHLLAWTGAVMPGWQDFGDLTGTRVYLSTAERDPWVDLADVTQTADALRRAGADLYLHVASSNVHTMRPPDFRALIDHLENAMRGDHLDYQTGFGNALASEARPGALPKLQNGPRKTPYGLYAEQINGTGFTVQRAHNHRVWMYRLRPQISGAGWQRIDSGRFAGRFDQGTVSPELLRFAPHAYPDGPVDFLSSLTTFAGAGDPTTKVGFAIHLYAATADMVDRAFSNIDGDMLIVPEDGALRIQTELGWLHVMPGEIAVLPRGIRFRIELPDGKARGFIGELFNGHYQLPERGPVGANGLADERHFKAPVAAFEDREVPYEIVHKQGGDLWRTVAQASPFDVVAWHGTYAPFKYDLMDFNAYWGANWDHPDPSILTVLTSPHDNHGRNAVDLAVFKGRWDTTEHSFRPPFLHRNSAIEFNAVIKTRTTSGPYRQGAFTYTPYLSPHGVSAGGYARAVGGPDEQADQPRRSSDDEMWIQLESTYSLRVMPWFTNASNRDLAYAEQFTGFTPAKVD
ncbi:MAG: homogentisate 1,2-dioxygenase, partial [Kiritimatiellia bacterium]